MRVVNITQSDSSISFSEITITIAVKGFWRTIFNLKEKIETYAGYTGCWYKYPGAKCCYSIFKNIFLNKAVKEYRWNLYKNLINVVDADKNNYRPRLLSHEEVQRELDKALKEENYEL